MSQNENVVVNNEPKVSKRKRANRQLVEQWENVNDIDSSGKTTTQLKRVGNFFVRDGNLYKTVTKNKEQDDIFVSRNVPIITKRLFDIETNQIYETIEYKVNGRRIIKNVPATTLTVKRNILELANDGLGVTDNNAKEIIDFIDSFKHIYDEQIEEEEMTTKIGFVNGHFIYPGEVNINIIQEDGFQQLVDNIKTKGTLEEWIDNVLVKYMDNKIFTFFIFTTCASILLKDMDVDPFIADLSGKSSSGKSSVMAGCMSVFGTNKLLAEWNTTVTALERRAVFMNNFPLFYDDTQKAPPHLLSNIAYKFSGGVSKGRGTIKGMQADQYYYNVLLSNGEIPITTYNENHAGAAARVITVNSNNAMPTLNGRFTEYYQDVSTYYGTAGIAFVKEYIRRRKEYKEKFISLSHRYFNQANGNEILSRLGRYFAVIHTAGIILQEVAGVDLNIESVMNSVYSEIKNGSNEAYNKPKQLLVKILEELDANRQNVKDGSEDDDRFAPMHAIKRNDSLYITINYINDRLGNEKDTIREQWIEKGYTVKGKNKDIFQPHINGVRPRAVQIKDDVLDILGFDFNKTK